MEVSDQTFRGRRPSEACLDGSSCECHVALEVLQQSLMAGEESAQPRQFRPQRGSMTETIVSGIAATLTTAAFVPQAYKIIQSRETAGVSLWMHVTFAVGVAFWFVLGVLIWNWPMMIANVVTFMLTLVIVGMKLYLK